MSLLTTTRQLVSEINSPDEFEALATAILRVANPLYANLIHVGTNVAGRTVKSPVDGIGLRAHRGSRHLLVVQHTITERKGLRRKWLAPEDGDLVKAKALAAAEYNRRAVRKATLVLCSTADPDQLLIRDVNAAAGDGLAVDIWPGSRLADFLDRDPEGQWLRQCQFGTEAVRLSPSQARSIASKSLDAYLPVVARADIVERALDNALLAFTQNTRGAGFVIGDSGLGKSAALRRLGDRWLEDGGIAIVLDHEVIEQSPAVDQAIAHGLRKWALSLDAGCGKDALSFATRQHPLLLIVEDINRSANPRRIVERLIGWSDADEKRGAAEWRLLCPIWGGNVGVFDRQLRDHVLRRSLTVDRFEPDEAAEAVMKRCRASGMALTKLQANELATSLGNDPLLIGLNNNWRVPDPSSAIESYITDNLKTSADDKLLVADLRSALDDLANRMVEARVIYPSWDEIRRWFGVDDDGLAGVRRLVSQEKIVRLCKDDRLAYRHDRVRDYLLVGAIVRLINAKRFTPDLWAEPFYAGLIGAALTTLPLECIDEAAPHNPVALFAALQNPRVNKEHHAHLLAAASQWFASPGFSGENSLSLKMHALQYLSQSDGAFVKDLVQPFPHNFSKLEALARNGHAGATAALCRTSEPGVRDPWRDRIIAHAIARFPTFVEDVATLLNQNTENLEGVLNLAGEIGDPQLYDALAGRWMQEGGTVALSTGWLWAVLRCCAPVGHPLADQVCRAWAALPSKVSRKPNKPGDNPRWDIGAYSLAWGLSRKSDPATLAFLICLPKRYRGLFHIVYFIISHIDAPEAINWSVKALASIDRRNDGQDRLNLALHSLERRWSPEQRGRALSPASRASLKTLWRNKRINRFDRRTAFRIWCLSPTVTELADLPALEADPVLADQALRTRLAAGDQTAVPLLSDRLRAAGHSYEWWYQARKVGLSGLEADVRRFFEERRRNPMNTHNNDGDHIVAELLMDSRSEFAIAMILENWDQLRTTPIFVQAALYLATPETTRLGQAAVTTSDNPSDLLNHIDMHWGIRVHGRPGITELAQLQALEPFLAIIGKGKFGEMQLIRMLEAANRLGELAWRIKHIDPIINASKLDYCLSDPSTVYISLDRELQRAIQSNHDWFGVEYWFKKREEELWDRDRLLGLVADWAADRESEPALRLLCEALMHFGDRRNLALLDRLPRTLRQIGSIPIANCVYDVQQHSL